MFDSIFQKKNIIFFIQIHKDLLYSISYEFLTETCKITEFRDNNIYLNQHLKLKLIVIAFNSNIKQKLDFSLKKMYIIQLKIIPYRLYTAKNIFYTKPFIFMNYVNHFMNNFQKSSLIYKFQKTSSFIQTKHL